MATDTGREFDGDELRSGLGLDDPRRLLRGLAGVVGFVVVWHLISLTQAAYVLPSPVAVGDAFAEEFASGTMTTALWSSIRHWIPGTVVGTGLGVAAGSPSRGAASSTT